MVTVRRLGRGLALAVCLAIHAMPVEAQAASYNIPAGDLRHALDAYARQTGSQIVYQLDQVKGRSPGVRGAMTPQDALRALLSGTGLAARSDSSGAIAIVPSRQPAAFVRPIQRMQQPARLAEQPAADVQEASATGLEEIVVTARRVNENLQSVPIAVSAMTGETLQKMSISNAFDLAQRVPSLTIASAGGVDTSAFAIGIRGVQSKSQLLLDDPPVGTVFAGSVVPHPYGFADVLYDLQSVQVLKGAQGTLFGRNTTGGVLVIDPRPASISEGFSGLVKLSSGNYNFKQAEAHLNLPLTDWAALRVAGVHKDRDGYSRNLLTNRRWDEVNADAFRVSLHLEPAAGISNDTVFDYLNTDATPSSARLLAVYPGGGALMGGNAQANVLLGEQKARGFYDFLSYQGTNGPLDLLAPNRCGGAATSPFQIYCRDEAQPRTYVKMKGVVNTTQWEVAEALTLKNIFSWRDGHRHLDGFSVWSNASLGPVSGVGNVALQDQEFTTWTDEFQFLGKAFDSRLTWVGGAFWMREKGEDSTSNFQGFGTATPAVVFRSEGRLKNTALGLYAQGTYALLDNLNLTFGFRHNKDKRVGSVSNFQTNVLTGVQRCNIFDGATANFLPMGNCALSARRKWSANTWTAAIDYKLGRNVLIYATTRHGYKAGGFYFRAVRANRFSYNPEYVQDYEVGAKADWYLAGRPIRTNLALFQADFTKQQLPVNDTTNLPITGYVDNVGKSRYRGGELEVTFKPADRLEMSGFVSYVDQKYVRYVDPGTGADLSWQTTAQPLSHWLGGLSLDYTVPVANDGGEFRLHADVSARSKVITNNINPLVFAEYPQKSYALVNLRADVRRIGGSALDLGAFVTNVTNKHYTVGVSNINGFTFAGVGAPRMFGVEATYHFGASADR